MNNIFKIFKKVKIDKYKSENIDLVNLKKDYDFKISKDISEIKNNDIFINCKSDNRDLFMITNLFFKYNEYESTEFKKDFIKSMLRITNNQDKTLDLYKNYSHYTVLSNYSNSLHNIRNKYGIKIPNNLKESEIFNELVKESEIDQKMDPIDKITKLSKFVYNTFEYNDDTFNEENRNKIIPIEKLIEKRVGRSFEMSIILFLLIKQDKTLKNSITKIRIGELVESPIENKFLDLNKNQKNIIKLNETELHKKLLENHRNNLKKIRDQKEGILKKLKRIEDRSKKTNGNNNVLNNNNININELDKIDKKYIDYLIFYKYLSSNKHAWVSVSLDQENKKQEYILDPVKGGIIIPKSLSLILPGPDNINWEGSKNLVAHFSKK